MNALFSQSRIALFAPHQVFYFFYLIRIALLLFLPFLLAVHGLAQQPSFINFNMDNGLASNEVYEILEDKKGNMWLATDKGISKYNGSEFKRYTIKEGLPDNTILGFAEDYRGRIWFRSLNGLLSYYEADSIHLVLPSMPFGHIISMYVDPKDTLWVATPTNQYKVFPKGNEGYAYEELNHLFIVNRIDSSLNGVIFGKPSIGWSYYFNINGTSHPFNPSELYTAPLPTFKIDAYNMGPDDIWLGISNTILSFSSDSVKVLREFDAVATRLFVTKNKEIFIGETKGIHQMKANGLLGKLFLNKYKITHVVKDREGGYWFSSLAHGVFYTSNFAVEAYDLGADHKISSIMKNPKGQLMAIGFYRDIYLDVGTGFTKVHDEKKDLKQYVPYHNNYELFSQSGLSVYPAIPKTVSHPEKMHSIVPYQILDKYRLWVSTKKIELRNIETDSILFSSSIHIRLKHSALYRHEDEFYIPTLGGLYRFDLTNKLYFYGDQHKELSQRINSVCIDDKERLWIASNHDGIFLLDGDELININRFNESIGSICRNVLCGSRYVWASTEYGLIRIDQLDFNNIEKFTIRDGLLSNDITSLFVDSGMVVLGHPTGLTKFPTDYERSNSTPLVYITDVNINREQQAILPSYELAYDHGPIDINYTGISYFSELQYKYRLRNSSDTAWTTTGERSVQFVSLSPGKYNFEVYALNAMNGARSTSRMLTLSISPPIWYSWWFIVLSILVGGLGILLFIKYRLESLRNTIEVERKLIDVEQQALRARMNPHFIFNSLNSVQFYILENDKKSANKYLSLFSKLIRSILQNSNKKLILLEKELEVLESYLHLEALRFKEKVHYVIKYPESLRLTHYKIPPLLLQPYVENAIWHGIMHRENAGCVVVEITDIGHCLLCTIEDDGVGRKRAKELKQKALDGYVSTGMNITANRIDLVNELYGHGFSVNIIDLNNHQEATGTRVEVRIPYLK